MNTIDSRNWQYRLGDVLFSQPAGKAGDKPNIHHMKMTIIRAAAPAILAIAAILLSFRYLSADALVAGVFCVAGVAAVMAVDYRADWKRPSSR
jgi:hypothetical protein